MITPKKVTKPSGRSQLERLVRWFLLRNTQKKWAREKLGGKWERWWVDCCNQYHWYQVHEFTTPDKRKPGGLWPDMGIYSYKQGDLPIVEDYSANATAHPIQPSENE